MDYSCRNEFVLLGTVNLLPVSFQSLNYDVCENMIYQKDEKAHSPKVKKKRKKDLFDILCFVERFSEILL